ncbi:hypothetical protein LB505_005613 [Fusarium chuoi]|nr:hypothetical protein LB505_005613 [Fusarium chuoi]
MPDISDQTISLLLRARNTCVRWFKLLRAESYKVVETETARRFQQYGLWAALLCKRTYVPLASGRIEFDDTSLEIFIQSSITRRFPSSSSMQSFEISDFHIDLPRLCRSELLMAWKSSGDHSVRCGPRKKDVLEFSREWNWPQKRPVGYFADPEQATART